MHYHTSFHELTQASTRATRKQSVMARWQSWVRKHRDQGHTTRLLRSVPDYDTRIVRINDGQQDRFAVLRGDSVHVVPVITTTVGIFTLLVAEFRMGAGDLIQQFPSRGIRDGEDALQTAMNVLPEETTVQAEWVHGYELLDFGSSNYIAPRCTNEQAHYVRCDVDLPEEILLSSLHEQQHVDTARGTSLVTLLCPLRNNLLRDLPTVGDKLALKEVLEQIRVERGIEKWKIEN